MSDEEKSVTFQATFDMHRQCLTASGDGEARLIFTLPASELAPLLKTYAYFREKLLQVTVKAIGPQG